MRKGDGRIMKEIGKFVVIGLGILVVDNVIANMMKMRSYNKTLKLIHEEFMIDQEKSKKKSKWI